MGKKTVRWKDVKKPVGVHSCNKCSNCGLIQSYDYITNKAIYYYCDCWYGKKAKQERETQ